MNVECGISSMEIDYNKLDPECVSLVKYFNSQGLTTSQCCQGHNKTNQSLFWISFASVITEADIFTFQKQHLDQWGNFCSCGNFTKRMFVYTDVNENGELELFEYSGFEYCAATVEAAHADLAQWEEQDALSN